MTHKKISRKKLLQLIKKELAINKSDIAKLIEIKWLIKEQFKIGMNEDIPELIDPRKKPLSHLRV